MTMTNDGGISVQCSIGSSDVVGVACCLAAESSSGCGLWVRKAVIVHVM